MLPVDTRTDKDGRRAGKPRGHRIRATALLACALAAPWADAAPKRRPLPALPLTEGERLCRAYGGFAYNRAVERNRGYTLTDVLLMARTWDAEHRVDADIRQIHELIVRSVYTNLDLSPGALRQLAELACVQALPQPAEAPVPDARLRY